MAIELPAQTVDTDDFGTAVDGMAEAATARLWGEFDSSWNQGGTEEQWNEARDAHKAAAMDDMSNALEWLIRNPLMFLDAYAEYRRG